MQLSYAFLHEVYPNWNSPQSSIQVEIEMEAPPDYKESTGELEVLANILKPYDKLRIVNSKLEIDMRPFKSFSRKITLDSRFKILKKLDEASDIKNFEKITRILCNSTYKDDLVFASKCDELKNLKIKNSLYINEITTGNTKRDFITQ